MEFFNIKDVLKEILSNALVQIINMHGADGKEKILGMFSIFQNIRLSELYTVNDIGAIYDSVNEYGLRNILVDSTCMLYAEVGIGESFITEITPTEKWNAVISVMANSLGCIRSVDSSDQYSALDYEYHDRGHNAEHWKQLLISNQWIIFIIAVKLYRIDTLVKLDDRYAKVSK